MEKICVIIPCYNEASRIRLDVFRDFLREQDYIDFCFVNDGSRDNTSEVLRYAVERCPERFLLVDNPDNRGKAEAVRSGMLHVASLGRYDLIGFLDADLATPLEDIHLLVEVMRRQPSVMMTMGARLKRLGANVQRKAYRHYMGRVFATVVSLLFRMPVYDSQCGAKLFRVSLVPEVFRAPFSSRWLFDVEILLRVRRLYPDYERLVCEVPLRTWIEQGDSRIRFSHLLKMPYELFQIYCRYA
ncbi:MAG: glycosyltransferase [Marinifilaceae bacterium]|nr:glycosyltransferase [Marinifilaceae bacterium]